MPIGPDRCASLQSSLHGAGGRRGDGEAQDAVRTAERAHGRHRARPPGAGGDGRRVLDRYRLVRRLGAGGFGVVWLAHDEQPRARRRGQAHRRSHDDAAPARAEREARAAARLTHPAIVALYEAGRDDEAVYLVSELVRGRTLAELDGATARSRTATCCAIGVALCDALAHAHERGVIHRDVKPGNVIVPDRPQTAAGVAKLTDFGVARMAGDDALTRTGDVVGTLAYMAPEQAEGARGGRGGRPLRARRSSSTRRSAGVNPVRGRGAARDRAPRRRAPAAAGAPAPRPAARAVRRARPRGAGRAPSSAARSPSCATALADGAARGRRRARARSPAARSEALPRARPRRRGATACRARAPRRPRRWRAGAPGRRGALRVAAAPRRAPGRRSAPAPRSRAAARAGRAARCRAWAGSRSRAALAAWLPPRRRTRAGRRSLAAALPPSLLLRRAAPACGRLPGGRAAARRRRPRRRVARARRPGARPLARAPRSARSGAWWLALAEAAHAATALAARRARAGAALRRLGRDADASRRCHERRAGPRGAVGASPRSCCPSLVRGPRARGRPGRRDGVGGGAGGRRRRRVAGTLSWQPTMRGLVAGAVVAGGLAVACRRVTGRGVRAFRLVASPRSDATSGWMPAPSGTDHALHERPAQPRGQDRRPRRGDVRPRLPLRGAAGRDRAQARQEMDEHQTVSVSRTYVPNEYVVWLSPEDRERFEGVEHAVIDELVGLPARARAPRAARAASAARRSSSAPTSACAWASSASRRGWCARRAGARPRPSRPTTATRWSTRPRPRARRSSQDVAQRAARGRGDRRGRGQALRRRRPAARSSAAAATATSCSTTPTSRAATPRSAPAAATAGRSPTSGSTNGVRVNGRAASTAPQPLQPGRPHRARHRRRRASRSSDAAVLEPVSVALKFGFLAVLYLFLLWVSRSALKDLRSAPRRARRRRRRRRADATGPARRASHGAGAPTARRPAAGRRARARAHARAWSTTSATGAVLGRGDQAEIRLEDPFASSRHARLMPPGRRSS